jgi:hypothetical protein
MEHGRYSLLISPAGNRAREYRHDGLVEKDIPYVRGEGHTIDLEVEKPYI